jgi:hypothetical protein
MLYLCAFILNERKMADKKYLNRICDGLLQRPLQPSGAALAEGAKRCGKTIAALNAAGVSYGAYGRRLAV